MNATNFADEKASVDEKRAAAERFSMTVCENGYVNVCNESHNDDSDHTYSVEVTDGKATGCPCLHAVHRGAHCKHQIAVENARNLALVAASGDVQPVTYAVGDHDRASEAPNGDRITVLTGANSGGKTTLLETLCQVVLLAHMGLPVPAERAEVNRFDAIVFHRRHASFNAGVLESTLRTIVPPLTKTDRTPMLVDEFEAITEPGSAADLPYGLVGLAVDSGAVGVYVTHFADDLEPLPEQARTDGIFLRGCNPI